MKVQSVLEISLPCFSIDKSYRYAACLAVTLIGGIYSHYSVADQQIHEPRYGQSEESELGYPSPQSASGEIIFKTYRNCIVPQIWQNGVGKLQRVELEYQMVGSPGVPIVGLGISVLSF